MRARIEEGKQGCGQTAGKWLNSMHYYGAYLANDPAGKIYYIIVPFRDPSVCFRIKKREINLFDDVGYVQRNSFKWYEWKETIIFQS